MKRAFVTGGAGFAGSHLVQRLVAEDWHVTVYDRHLRPAPPWYSHDYSQSNVLNRTWLNSEMYSAKPDVVFHLAALADVRSALKETREQIQQNLVATFNVLEAMRAASCKQIVFFSSAVVYGDTPVEIGGYGWPGGGPQPPDAKPWTWSIPEKGTCFPQQTSVYGAMKLASEALIEAYCAGYGFRADIFRLVSLLGTGYKHGNLIDFYRKLKQDPTTIHLLGTGREQKYYVDADDVADAVVKVLDRARPRSSGAEIWNVSSDEHVKIDRLVDLVATILGITPAKTHEQTTWTGDLPSLVLDCSKLRALGWSPQTGLTEAVTRTLRDFLARDIK